MPWIMIKNNLKLMLRSKWLLGIMIIGPIIIIASLSSAFHSIMDKKTEVNPYHVGYSMEAGSPYEAFITPFAELGKEKDFDLIQFESNEARDMIKNDTVQVFVDFGVKEFTIYSSDTYDAEASIVKYILFEMTHAATELAEIPTEEIEFIKVPDTVDYYGKVELTFFLWCGLCVLSTVIASERKNRIQSRLRLAPKNNIQLYLGKVIPCFLAIVILTTISTVTSTIIFDIHWGCYFKTVGLLVLVAAAASAFGIALFYIIPNVAVSIVLGFVIVWIMGFFGGTFETYMYSSASDTLKSTSPIYHLNRALVEYETLGKSAYGWSTVWFHIAIIVVCSIVGCVLMKRRMEDR